MNDRMIGRLVLTAALSLPAFTMFAPATAQAQGGACARAVQGRIAWDYNGNTKWAANNINRLCRNSNNAEPARCFKKAMHGNVNWGGGTQWEWKNAIDLCEQSTNANQTIQCFKENVGKGWKKAIASCDERAPKLPPCQRALQGKVAWDYKGNTKWAANNMARLCRNARNDQPARCFKRAMHGNINWGGGTKWEWKNAIDLCEQSDNANRTISCFQRNVGRGWKAAIKACDERAPKITCRQAVQGKIAWDYKGNKKWAANNVNRLCGNIQHAEPAQCFQQVMHGNINWGGGTKWEWKNAIDLCEKSQNANRTVNCFKRKLKRGKGWKQAIAQCDERNGRMR